MLKLNINKKRKLNFEVQIGGIESNQLSGSLKFKIDGVEYGFPVEINNESITAEIPPLRNIIKREIQEGEKIDGSLELNGNGYFIDVWKDTFKVTNPVTVEAKITNEDNGENSKIPNLDINIISEKEKINKKIKNTKPKKNKKKELTLESLTKEHLFKFMETRGSKNPRIQEIIYNNAIHEAASDEPKDIFRVLVKILSKK